VTKATPAVSRAPRADAVRNRDKLVAAARALFAEGGVDTPLERVAADAGVGIGTLYRNFPSRQSLIEAVYRSQSEEIVANGKQFGETMAPDDALVAVFDEYLRTAASKRGMKEVILAELGADAPVFVDSRENSRAMIETILVAGQEQGLFRDDVTADQVFRLIGGLSMTCHVNGDIADSRPLVRVVIDGLRRTR
jgi:AcrR family transcriptional regulator